ncbi:MAG: ZIP family metal transporter [Actinomycetota bacterium]|nr:ZIP family metal transporter [Actinomycetota bacterium]
MSTAQVLLLGALAGATIFVGLPMGRVQGSSASLKAFFSATATGILLFLFWDVTSEVVRPVETALDGRHWDEFSGYSALAGGGFAAGLLGLVYYQSWMKARQRKAFLGPGAAAASEFDQGVHTGLSPAQWLAVLIATGIGLHNFSEGLAIGQAAADNSLKSLAFVLVIGFALHNATEGFGIVAPMAGDATRPSWRFLALLGLIGGVPTFFGTLIGHSWTNEAVSVAFFALAAGSILYVVIELLNVCRRFTSSVVTSWGILLGLVLGFATDFILHAAGV